MLLVNTALSQFATFVDEAVCSETPTLKTIPEIVRIRAVINILEENLYASIQFLDVPEGRVEIAYAEFSGEAEEWHSTIMGLPYRPIRLDSYIVPAVLLERFSEAVRSKVVDDEARMLQNFWHLWSVVQDAIAKRALYIYWWDQHGRLFLKGNHDGKAFTIPDLLISGIGKHL